MAGRQRNLLDREARLKKCGWFDGAVTLIPTIYLTVTCTRQHALQFAFGLRVFSGAIHARGPKMSDGQLANVEMPRRRGDCDFVVVGLQNVGDVARSVGDDVAAAFPTQTVV